MTDPEITELLNRLNGIFPAWKATDEETRAWRKVFGPLDAGDANLAMDDFFLMRRFSRPEPSKFLTCYQSRRTRAGETQGKQTERVIDTFIQCVEADPAFPGRLGRFVPVLGRLDVKWTREELQAAADNMRDRHEITYGGRWVVAYDSSFEERAERRLQLQAKEPT